MLDTGLRSASSGNILDLTPATPAARDLQRLLLDSQTRVGGYVRHSLALLLPRAFGAHPGCRVGAFIRLHMTRTRSTVLSPPMATQLPVGTDVVTSTPNGFLLGNPFWGLAWGHLGTGATHPFRVRFGLGRSNRPIEPWSLIVKRHLGTFRVGHSMALNGHRLYRERCLGAGIYHQTPRQPCATALSASHTHRSLQMFDTGLT